MINKILVRGITSLMAASVIMAFIPVVSGGQQVSAAHSWDKTMDNTTLGTSGIPDPTPPKTTRILGKEAMCFSVNMMVFL